MAEARPREVEPDAAEALALALVDGQHERDLDGEVSPPEGERKAGVRGLQDDPRDHHVVPDELAGDDDAFKDVVADAREEEPRPVAEPVPGAQVADEHEYGADLVSPAAVALQPLSPATASGTRPPTRA